jgi:superfamily II DNA helicase RecQ
VRKAPTREALEAEADGRLVGELKAWRLARARLEGVPAYRVLTDATLLAIAAQLPRTADELLQVHGIGARLVEKYGRELLAELNR